MISKSIATIAVAFAVTLGSGCALDDSAEVRFITPTDGDTVSSPFVVEMATRDFTIEPASNGVTPGRGHLHIMIDTPCVQERLTVPPDEQHLHFGQGQTSTTLDLPPGSHFLCLQAADGNHKALSLTAEIEIIVE